MQGATTARVRNGRPSDVDEARALLAATRLPLGGFPEDLESFVVADLGGRLGGVAALERHGSCGLLRSLAVAPDARGRGIASRLCASIERGADALDLTLFLLTETARSFFERRGYVVVDRRSAPDAVRRSTEFSQLCPETADLMKRHRREPIG